MQPVSYNATFDMQPAVPGLLADSGFTDKITVPCGAAAHAFGTVVAAVAATGVSVRPIGTNVLQGIAIYDATLAGRHNAQDGYVQYDAISTLRRGRIWARASGTCTKDAVAKFDPATGVFADAGTATYPNARFLSGNITSVALLPGETTEQMVLVELGEPTLPAAA
jgi:hypothetical protein